MEALLSLSLSVFVSSGNADSDSQTVTLVHRRVFERDSDRRKDASRLSFILEIRSDE